MIVSTYQSTSGTGQRAVEELHDQTQAVLEAEEVSASVYPHQIAFNILPQVETFKDGDDYTTEERKMMAETRKILGDETIAVSATCVRVPVYNAHRSRSTCRRARTCRRSAAASCWTPFRA